MSMQALGITQRSIPEQWVTYQRFNLMEREEIVPAIRALAKQIPPETIAGDPYCIIQYFSSYPQGYEAEVGFPIQAPLAGREETCKRLPALSVLEVLHQGPSAALAETKRHLNQFTREHALISDEFVREEYPGWQVEDGDIRAQFVIHDWNGLLAQNVERVLGGQACRQVLQGAETLTPESSPAERFAWAQGAVTRLEGLADDFQRYDVISSCAHIYPPGQLEKLRRVYVETLERSGDGLEGVDAVLAFMANDPGWGEKGAHREGKRIFHTKNPMDPEAHARATTPQEKWAAACFCPVIRNRLAEGMPVSYCYCGAGWYRQQWETATGKPVRVEVAGSVLRGDDACSFIVTLADEL